MKIQVLGAGHYLPGRKITNRDMEDIFSIREDWINQLIGTKTRHFSIDFKKKTVEYSLKDICVRAAERAIKKAKINRESIDLLILSTATPDHLMPATVNLVADELGMNGVATFQLQSGCSGAVQAIEMGCRLLESRVYKHALVIGGDVCNKYMDAERNFLNLRSSELINYALFGDGAGAIVLSNSPENNHTGITFENVLNRFVGQGRPPGQIMNWFGHLPENINDMGKKERRKKFESAKEDYKAIEASVPEMTNEVIDELLAIEGWNREDVDLFLPPQLSGIMTQRIIDSLGINTEKTINCVEKTGNNGNALPFIQLNLLIKSLKPGQRAMGIAIESSKWIKTGFTLTKS
ncbi:3-oxoacyl-ACP synthase III family protein [Shouchella patagoniensis]|uniref:3-oxoacyl-ACP synthase III family protein n=1 Tax=Shouchella patagoniensis TaxID=228576 RepID=UPI00099525B3|nr:3-oxoacyl-ACP synthase III family protein [Shouchella patagoniensis]